MKKIPKYLFIAVTIVLIIFLIFIWYDTPSRIYSNFGTIADYPPTEVTWVDMPEAGDFETEEYLTFHNLMIPSTFISTNKRELADGLQAYKDKKSIFVTKEETDYLSAFNREEKKNVCAFFSRRSSVPTCQSDYDNYRSILEVELEDPQTFASQEELEIYSKIMIVRSASLNHNIVSAFETAHVRGFLFQTNEQYQQADLFDESDNQYRILFSDMDMEEIAYIINNITYSK